MLYYVSRGTLNSTHTLTVIVASVDFRLLTVQAEAQQLEMATLRKFGAGIGAPTRQKQLSDAADIHVKLGNVQRYCELMIELGQVMYLLQIS